MKKDSFAQGTIEEFFGKKFSKKSIAQGTIEYLVILAIIVVISLVVVGISMGILENTGSQIPTKSSQIALRTGAITITDSVVNQDGDYLLQVGNNSGERITIESLSIGDNTQEDIGRHWSNPL